MACPLGSRWPVKKIYSKNIHTMEHSGYRDTGIIVKESHVLLLFGNVLQIDSDIVKQDY